MRKRRGEWEERKKEDELNASMAIKYLVQLVCWKA